MKSARQWKTYYAAERARLGEAGLCVCLERALAVELPARGALVFPHTRLDDPSGELAAAAALAVLRSGCDAVLALGVLHGGREADADLVQRARQGRDEEARRRLRRVHGPGAPAAAGEEPYWREEFSLDGFLALLALAARRAGVPAPRVVCRYPFLVGEDPADLPGLEELHALVAAGAALVATADLIHHGHGYGTPPDACLAREGEAAHAYARGQITRGFDFLGAGDYAGFLGHAAEVRSDFRDGGPVLTELLRAGAGVADAPWQTTLHELRLVDYADALGAPPPTWVAAALVSVAPVGQRAARQR